MTSADTDTPFLAEETSDPTLPVQCLADLSVTQSAGFSAESARVDIMHRGQALVSLDPADAATLAGMVATAFAAAWVGTNDAGDGSTVTL
jgi:hypothetical protein